MYALCLLVVVGAGVGIAIGLTGGDEPAGPPVDPAPTAAPTIKELDPMLEMALQFTSDSSVFEDANSPQSQALAWLQSEMMNESDMSDTRLVSRYALAVLYYSTQGSLAWSQQYLFLTNTNECEWFRGNAGVGCDVNGDIVEIVLGMYC